MEHAQHMMSCLLTSDHTLLLYTLQPAHYDLLCVCFCLLIKCCCQTTGQVTPGQREWRSPLGVHDFTWQGVVSLH